MFRDRKLRPPPHPLQEFGELVLGLEGPDGGVVGFRKDRLE
jgi:hypothetical protein